VIGFFRLGSRELFAWPGFEGWSSWSLISWVARIAGMSHWCSACSTSWAMPPALCSFCVCAFHVIYTLLLYIQAHHSWVLFCCVLFLRVFCFHWLEHGLFVLKVIVSGQEFIVGQVFPLYLKILLPDMCMVSDRESPHFYSTVSKSLSSSSPPRLSLLHHWF
jgi:hypothetical protein